MSSPFVLTRLSQLRCVLRVLDTIKHERCFATYTADQSTYTTTFRRLYYKFRPDPIYNLEVIVKNTNYKMCLWLRMDGWCNLRDIKVYGMCREDRTWSHAVLSERFDEPLAITQALLQTMFNRIEIPEMLEENILGDIPVTSTTRYRFFKNVQQPCNERVRVLMIKYIQQRRMIRTFQKKHMVKRAWYGWLAHFYSPDTSGGYMEKRINSYQKIHGTSCNSTYGLLKDIRSILS